MTLHIPTPCPANAMPPEPEPFAVFAEPELAALAAVEVPRGICAHPDCSRVFEPARDWQRFCSDACRRASVTEARKWGLKMAEPLLVWRLFKYSAQPQERAACRAARRYITQCQSAWIEGRTARRAHAMAQQKGGQG